jgi:hypothetical protein
MMRELCDTVEIDYPHPSDTTAPRTGTIVRLTRRLH